MAPETVGRGLTRNIPPRQNGTPLKSGSFGRPRGGKHVPKPAKIETVKTLTASLQKAESAVLVEFQGLSVGDLTNFRREVRSLGGELRVVKNTLLSRALGNASVSGLEAALKGPTLAVFGYADPVATVKAVSDFGREHKEQWHIKAGVLAGRAISAQETERLAALPTREQLLGQVAGLFAAPMTRLARVLSEPLAQTARALGAIAEQKQGQGAA